MKSNTWLALVLAGFGASVMTGCIDNDYDLSDIDTTARVDVKDLVVPVNLDEIRMSSIIEIKEGDRVQIIDGQYAVVDSGTFVSNGVRIDEIVLARPNIDPTESTIHLISGSGGTTLPGGEYLLGDYDIKSDPTGFNYESRDLDEAIIDIETITSPLTLTVNISISELASFPGRIEVADLIVQLPKGMTIAEADGGEYDPETGEIKFATRRFNGTTLSFTVKATAFDFKQMGGKITGTGDSRTVGISSSCFVKSGNVSVIGSSQSSFNVPANLTMRTVYDLSEINVKMFTGTVKYNIEGVNINDVELNDLPDILSQKGTKVRLANPRIYLHVNNPVQEYGLEIRSGLTITSNPRFDGQPFSNSIDNGFFTIGTDHPSAIYNFCIAPNPDGGVAGYENAAPVKFTKLSDVLFTDGLPASLGITLDDPRIPESRVVDFRLGTTLGDVDGRYKFVAPFDLLENSTIVYRDTVDGWSSEDLDYMTITKLDVDLDVTTDIPLSATMTGYPIDVNGNQIGNVQIEGADIQAMAKDQHITLHITGEVHHLDGIIFRAEVNSISDNKPLTPDMTIRIKNLRPRVSGYYQREL